MNARTDPPLGLFHDLAIDEYHASPAISNSGLADFAKSPFHYHALHLNPKRPPRATKTGQFEGNLAHCTILEPAVFSSRYAVGPAGKRGTKLWDAFEESLPAGQVSVKEDQRQVAFAQAMSVRGDPELSRLLSSGRPEVSAFWIDPGTGEHCRCRPDWVHPLETGGVILVDVKTCGAADPREFSRQIARMGYHRQAAWYSDGYEMASGAPVLAFIFAAVEMTWPYACSAVMLDDASLEKGRAENRALLDRFATCRRADTWPGYAGVQLVSLPRWALDSLAPVTEESTA